MSRDFRHTLERLALLVAGLFIGWLVLSGDSHPSPDKIEETWLDGYRRGQADYYRAIRKSEGIHRQEIAVQPSEPGARSLD